LLAQLHLDSLVGKKSPKAVRAAIAALQSLSLESNVYDVAYNDAMLRIEGQVTDQEDLAKQVLSWITCANRPLNIAELQHALAVEINEQELDKENISEIEDAVSVCAGLVTVDRESGIIHIYIYIFIQHKSTSKEHKRIGFQMQKLKLQQPVSHTSHLESLKMVSVKQTMSLRRDYRLISFSTTPHETGAIMLERLQI
jgi:hypothetical protein